MRLGQSVSLHVLTCPFLGALQFVSVLSLVFFWSADLSPFFCACRELGFFFLYFPFFDAFIPFLGTLAHIKQTDIILLQCAVAIFLFYLDCTNGLYSLVFVYLLAMAQITP